MNEAKPEFPGGLRGWIAVLVMLSSAPSLALMFSATSPVLTTIARHFAPAGAPVRIPLIGIGLEGSFYAQLMAVLPSVGLMLGSAPAGIAIDRFGARRVLIGGAVAFAILGSAGLYIDSALLLLASRFVLGFAAMPHAAATIWLIGTRFDDVARARALSARNMAAGITGVAAVGAAGQLAQAHGWHAPFGMFLGVLAVIPFALASLPATPPAASARTGAAGSLRHLWPLYGVMLVLSIVMMMNSTQLPFLLAANGITTPIAQSHVMIVGTTMTIPGSLAYAVLGARLGSRRNFSIIALALGTGILTIGLSSTPLLLALGAGLSGFGSGMLVPHFIRLVLDRAPGAIRGRAIGFAFVSVYLGDLLNPFAIHPITEVLGIRETFMTIGGLTLASALQILLPRGAPAAMREQGAGG